MRKSRIQLQREVVSPRVLSLVMSFEGTMVLNAELLSMNSILTKVFPLSKWTKGSVDLLGRYANCSGSKGSRDNGVDVSHDQPFKALHCYRLECYRR